MSRKSPNIRQSACGKNESVYLGGCTNQKKTSIDGVAVRHNTTKVKNYAVPASPLYIDPYAQPEQDTAPDCSGFHADVYTCGDFENGFVPCGLPLTTSLSYSGSVFPVGRKYFNSFTVSETEKVDFSSCRSVGTKQVYANKAWQGRFSYSSRMRGGIDSMTACCGCQVHDFDPSPETVKYLSMSANSSKHIHTILYKNHSEEVNGEFCCPKEDGGEICSPDGCVSWEYDRETDHKASAANSTHVDRFGNFYVDTCTSSSSGFTDDDPVVSQQGAESFANDAWFMLGKANGDILTIRDLWCDLIGSMAPPDILTGTDTAFHAEWQDVNECFDKCGNLTKSETFSYLIIDVDLTAGTFRKRTKGKKGPKSYCISDGSCHTVVQTSDETYRYGGTSMLWTLNATGIGSLSFDQTENSQVIGNLATPYSITEVQNTMRSLLGEWDLGDDARLPWRTAVDLQGPLVCYDEGQNAPTIGVCSSAIQFSGRLMGRPAPRGITPGVFNFEHANYDYCQSSNGFDICDIRYTETWGAWSNSIGIPCATQWLTKRQIAQMPGFGAFVGMNFFWTTPSTCNSTGPTAQYDDTVWGSKVAIIIHPERKSYNYSKPCGDSRFQIAQGTDRCIASVADMTLTLEPNGSATNISTGDKVFVGGTGTVDGIWTATKDSDFQITLNDCIVPASKLHTLPIEDSGDGMIAKLRWQHLPPAICGRVDIASITNTSPVVCTLAEPQYLTDSDKVIITGAEGASINGLWSVEVNDPSTITLLGSSAPGTAYKANSGQAYSPSAPDWRWNDNESKHEFRLLEFYMYHRDIGEYARIQNHNDVWLASGTDCDGNPCALQPLPPNPRTAQATLGLDQSVYSMVSATKCQTVSPCRPMVAYFSPNSDKVPGGVNYGFPTMTLDPGYGGIKWFGTVVQTDTDYLWQSPPCPCTADEDGHFGCNRGEDEKPWRMDDGTCDHGAYAHAPQVEARGKPVEGAPALPPGVHIGCITPSNLSGGNVCNPPAHDANADPTSFDPLISYPPYHPLFLRELGCVCNGGEFADDYTKDGIKCSEIMPAP